MTQEMPPLSRGHFSNQICGFELALRRVTFKDAHLVQKLSPVMKGLVETRARADAECIRLTKLVEELNRKLGQALAERTSCDQLIIKLNARIRANQIQPIQAWQGRYGKRGSLSKAIVSALESAYPLHRTTTQLAEHLQSKFDLFFFIPRERWMWVNNTLSRLLNRLAKANRIRALHNSRENPGLVGRWVWNPPASDTATLQALAAQAGLPTTCTLNQDPLEPTSEPAPEEDDLPR